MTLYFSFFIKQIQLITQRLTIHKIMASIANNVSRKCIIDIQRKYIV